MGVAINGVSVKDIVAWLEKQEQKPVEWSEEDNAHIESIISTIECNKAQFPNSTAVVEAYNADLNWLKSLRPQKQWKPSENELEVLRLAAEKDGTCLMGLYEQLKAL